MIRPTLEVADIIRAQGERFIERSRSWLTWPQRKVLQAIERCRTAALGGHRDRCARCGYRAISYNSCRNRHCPKCQTGARNRWLAERSKELLPVRYVHVVFTLPHQLAPVAYQNKRLVYRLLFQASAATLLEVAAGPRHLGAQIGFLSVLHTWGQNLQLHPHVHCVIPAGGLSADHTRWIQPAIPSSCRSRSLAACFGVSLWPVSGEPPNKGNSDSTGTKKPFGIPSDSVLCSVPCFDRTGSFTPSHPSVDPNTSCTIWPVTPIGSPSPTIACSPFKAARSHSAGKTMPMGTRSGK